MYLLIDLNKPEQSKIYKYKQTLANDIHIHVHSINKPVKHIKSYVIIETDPINGNKVNNFKR